MKRVCLVTGGSGFFGKSLVRLLCEQEEKKEKKQNVDSPPYRFDEIRVLDVTKFDWAALDSSHHSKIVFTQGDVCESDKSLLSIYEGVDTVFHLASVVDVGLTKNPLLQKVNVDGTKAVIEACKKKSVPRLVYTSSIDVVFDGGDHINISEKDLTYPKHYLIEYIRTKVEAEKLVLGANSKELATTAIRPAHLYGPGDNLAILTVLRKIKSKELPFTLGDHKALFDCVYIDNCAYAHILAARQLSDRSQVAGEAYFICENYHVNWWDFCRPYIEAKGFKVPKYSLPVWLFLFFAVIAEILHFLWDNIVNNWITIKFVTKRQIIWEPTFHRYHVVVCRHATFLHDKATKDFGYQPIVSREDALKRTLAWLDTVKL